MGERVMTPQCNSELGDGSGQGSAWNVSFRGEERCDPSPWLQPVPRRFVQLKGIVLPLVARLFGCRALASGAVFVAVMRPAAGKILHHLFLNWGGDERPTTGKTHFRPDSFRVKMHLPAGVLRSRGFCDRQVITRLGAHPRSFIRPMRLATKRDYGYEGCLDQRAVHHLVY